MSKADKIEETIVNVAILGAGTAAILAFLGHCKKMAEKEEGVGSTNTYTKTLLNRYLSSNRITDVSVDLSDRDETGRYYVICGDEQGGRGFYAPISVIHDLYIYCKRNNIEYGEYNADIA